MERIFDSNTNNAAMAKTAENRRGPDELDPNATVPVGGRVSPSVSDDVTDAEINEAIERIARKPAGTPSASSRVDSVQSPVSRDTVPIDRRTIPVPRPAIPSSQPPQGPGEGFDPNKTISVSLDQLYASMPFEIRQRAKLGASTSRLAEILAGMKKDVEAVLREAMDMTHPLPPAKAAELKTAGEVLRIVEAATKRLTTKVKDAPDWEETNTAINQLLIATLRDSLPAVEEYLTPGLLSPDERFAIGEDLSPLFDGKRITKEELSALGAEERKQRVEEAMLVIDRDDLGSLLRSLKAGTYDGTLPSFHDVERELKRQEGVLEVWWDDLSTEEAERLVAAVEGRTPVIGIEDHAPAAESLQVERCRRALAAADGDAMAALLRDVEVSLAKEVERRTTDPRYAVN